jgi:hypothetical protein
MSYNLILDDERTVDNIVEYTDYEWYYSKQWEIVRTYDDFCKIINEKGLPNIVSFDHDIADFKNGEERSGKTAAQFMIDYCIDNDLDFPEYLVHSANPRGADNIAGLIENFLDKRREGFFD